MQRDEDSLWIHFKGQTWLWRSQKPSQKEKKSTLKSQGLIKSTLPGRIQKVFVKKGDKVKSGQNLLTLLAMKMEYSFKAEGEGEIEDIFCSEGQNVDSDKKLIRVCFEEDGNG